MFEAGVGHGGAISKSLMMRMVLQIDPEGWMEFGEAEVRAGMAESHKNKRERVWNLVQLVEQRIGRQNIPRFLSRMMTHDPTF